MMLAGGNIQEYNEIKLLSIKDYLNKLSNFVDKIEQDHKIAQAKERSARK